MGALFDDEAVFDDHDPVGILYGGQPVGDYDGGPSLGQFLETLLDALYYASECGEDGLKDQEDYFTYLLLKKERNYFAARLGGVEL